MLLVSKETIHLYKVFIWSKNFHFFPPKFHNNAILKQVPNAFILFHFIFILFLFHFIFFWQRLRKRTYKINVLNIEAGTINFSSFFKKKP
jgi:hypothetical protein